MCKVGVWHVGRGQLVHVHCPPCSVTLPGMKAGTLNTGLWHCAMLLMKHVPGGNSFWANLIKTLCMGGARCAGARVEEALGLCQHVWWPYVLTLPWI